jgi:hypothetical protein
MSSYRRQINEESLKEIIERQAKCNHEWDYKFHACEQGCCRYWICLKCGERYYTQRG